jgi:hypothetical protein
MTREEAKEILTHNWTRVDNPNYSESELDEAFFMAIEALKEAQKHEETFEWCSDCKEYDKDNCCCHRWSKEIRNTVEELKAEWTPITVSEPNTSYHVLVTYKWDEDDYETSELDYWVAKHEAENGNEKCKRLIDHVIAWRRMPDPCQEENK